MCWWHWPSIHFISNLCSLHYSYMTSRKAKATLRKQPASLHPPTIKPTYMQEPQVSVTVTAGCYQSRAVIRRQRLRENQQPTRHQQPAINHAQRGHRESSMKGRRSEPTAGAVSALWVDRDDGNPHTTLSSLAGSDPPPPARCWGPPHAPAVCRTLEWRDIFNMLQLRV